MPDLSAADIAEGRRRYAAFFDGSDPVEYLLGWVAEHLPALLDAAEKVARIAALAARWQESTDWKGDPAMADRAFGDALARALDTKETETNA